jgi:hypothetical protein
MQGKQVSRAHLFRHVLIAALSVVLVIGCSDDQPSTSLPESSSTTSVVPAPWDTTPVTWPATPVTWPATYPQNVQNRQSLPDCGQYDAQLRPKSLPEEDQAKLDCFWTAVDTGRGAELRVIVPMLDSPAIPTMFRAYPNGKKEVQVAATTLPPRECTNSPGTTSCIQLVFEREGTVGCHQPIVTCSGPMPKHAWDVILGPHTGMNRPGQITMTGSKRLGRPVWKGKPPGRAGDKIYVLPAQV